MNPTLRDRIIGHLLILKQLYEDNVVPTMVDDGDHEERVEEIAGLLKELGYEDEEDAEA